MQSRLVAHLRNGTVVKGVSFDVDPAKPSCHVKTDSGVVEVRLEDAKALFFVRDLAGDPARTDAQEAVLGDSRLRGTTRLEILFQDGERLVALTNRFPPRGRLFFVVPVDPASNNSRILVNQDAVSSLHAVPAQIPTGATG